MDINSVEIFLHPEETADTISHQLSEKIGQPVHVECGRSRFLAKKVGSTFTCDASTGSGKTATITVTVKDRQGSFDWILK
jgi:hypothetical protein